MDTILKLDGITKCYPGVKALDNISFAVERGTVHALMGENGAGKSTLIKVISGAVKADGGKIWVNDQPYEKMTPALSRQLGIGVIYQEYNLVPSQSVLENVFLGARIGNSISPNKQKMKEKAEAIFRRLGVHVNLNAMVHTLSVAQQQLVEIAKALSQNAQILIMDEPSATLTVSDVKRLFEVIRKLKSEGVTIMYISHRMEEIFEIADNITVLRDGCHVKTCNLSDLNSHEIIHLMVGRELNESYPERHLTIGGPVLELKNVTGNGDKNISFVLHKGEILGLAGLVGAGRTELAKVIFGAAKKTSGEILVKGKAADIHTPEDAVRLGIGLIPEDRKNEGCFLDYSIRWNVSIMALKKYSKKGVMNNQLLDEKAEEMRHLFRIKTPSLEQLARNLSGGNQQKTVLAKALAADTDILIFDEPTRGIDIGVKHDIYNLMNEIVNKGVSIIMISSEMEELMGMSDRILVLHEGRMVGELQRKEYDAHRILELASGMEGENNENQQEQIQ